MLLFVFLRYWQQEGSVKYSPRTYSLNFLPCCVGLPRFSGGCTWVWPTDLTWMTSRSSTVAKTTKHCCGLRTCVTAWWSVRTARNSDIKSTSLTVSWMKALPMHKNSLTKDMIFLGTQDKQLRMGQLSLNFSHIGLLDENLHPSPRSIHSHRLLDGLMGSEGENPKNFEAVCWGFHVLSRANFRR